MQVPNDQGSRKETDDSEFALRIQDDMIETLRAMSEPIKLGRRNGKLVITDGHHRKTAMRALGLDVPAVIE